MIKEIRDYLEKYQMIEVGEDVVIGISGGADSVCLLLVLHKLSQTMNFQIQPVHINHNLRGYEGKKDEEFTVEFCKSLGYQCIVKSVDILKVARESGVSTEEAGRNERRRILMAYANKSLNGKVALGHHIDDNVETGILNLCRGTGIRGLGGIEPVSGAIIRPLLSVRREDIEGYLQEQGQSYRIDSSNLSCDYTRNKVRNKVMPLLKAELNQKSVEHIHDTMLELREIATYMEEDILKAFTQYVKKDEVAVVISHELLEVNPLIGRGVVKKALGVMLKAQKDITRAHVVGVYQLYNSQVGRKINLPRGLTASRCYAGITLSFGQKVNIVQQVPCIALQIPGQTIINDGRVIETEILVYNDQETFRENHYTKYFDYDIIGDKLFIDKVRDSDYFIINQKGNTQSLKKYAKNEKIPKDRRSELMCIRSQDEIQWLFDYRVGFRSKINEGTKLILKIQIGGEGNGR